MTKPSASILENNLPSVFWKSRWHVHSASRRDGRTPGSHPFTCRRLRVDDGDADLISAKITAATVQISDAKSSSRWTGVSTDDKRKIGKGRGGRAGALTGEQV